MQDGERKVPIHFEVERSRLQLHFVNTLVLTWVIFNVQLSYIYAGLWEKNTYINTYNLGSKEEGHNCTLSILLFWHNLSSFQYIAFIFHTFSTSRYRTDGQTDRQTPDKVIPMCRYTSQVTQKRTSTFKILKKYLYCDCLNGQSKIAEFPSKIFCKHCNTCTNILKQDQVHGKSEHILFASNTHCSSSLKTYQIRWSGISDHSPECCWSFWKEGPLYEITVVTEKLSQILVLYDITPIEQLICQLSGSNNETVIFWTCPGAAYVLRNKTTISGAVRIT